MKTLFAILIFLLSLPVFGQKNKFERSKDVGLLYGTSYYIGEVNPYKHFGTRMKSGGGISFRNNFNRRWTLKSSVLYHVVEAWDADSDDPWIRNRNLSFRNQIIEGSVQGELNFFNYQLGNSKYRFSPYLFSGLAYYRMRPMAQHGTSFSRWGPKVKALSSVTISTKPRCSQCLSGRESKPIFSPFSA